MRIKEKNIYNLEKEKKDINNNKKKPPLTIEMFEVHTRVPCLQWSPTTHRILELIPSSAH